MFVAETKLDIMKAFKVFNPDWTCRGFRYEVGETYTHKGDISMCSSGFHACKRAVDCFNYYDFDPKNKVAEVILTGVMTDGDKSVGSKIKIVKEIKWDSLLTLVNIGYNNSGYNNSGERNSGNNNSGNGNSGDGNSGDGNSGDGNSGNGNSGHNNSGDNNSGYRNSGYRNSGHNNSGHNNSGDRNSGYRNSGDNNSGYNNSGHRNSGHNNSGYNNSGDGNSGDGNSGDGNSGNNNSGNNNSGHFNSITPDEILVFNKPCKKSVWNLAKKPSFIYFDLCSWVLWDSMTIKEKKGNKNAFITGGYLKEFEYKEAWKKAYRKATKEDVKLLKKLPNFDADVFYEITGIRIK